MAHCKGIITQCRETCNVVHVCACSEWFISSAFLILVDVGGARRPLVGLIKNWRKDGRETPTIRNGIWSRGIQLT